jgi:hypothetical protein
MEVHLPCEVGPVHPTRWGGSATDVQREHPSPFLVGLNRISIYSRTLHIPTKESRNIIISLDPDYNAPETNMYISTRNRPTKSTNREWIHTLNNAIR